MTDNTLKQQVLPSLPYTNYNGYSDGSEPLYTAEQMQDYALAALDAAPVQPAKAEVALYQRRMLPNFANNKWHDWETCSQGSYEDTSKLGNQIDNQWVYEARALAVIPGSEIYFDGSRGCDTSSKAAIPVSFGGIDFVLTPSDKAEASSDAAQDERLDCELGIACICTRESGCPSESCQHYEKKAAAAPSAAPAQEATDRDAALESAVQAVAERAGDADRIAVTSAFDAIRALKNNRFALPESAHIHRPAAVAAPAQPQEPVAFHTPLPWRVTEPNEKKGPREIVGANGATVAKLTALDLPNAELIVSSVNPIAQPAAQQEIERLRKLADEATDKALEYATKYESVIQAITDPENQPSQYGTVLLSSQPSAQLTDAEFLSKRLARVAKLVGVPMPDMTHEQVAEVAGTILGTIARKLEEGRPAAQCNAIIEQCKKACLEVLEDDTILRGEEGEAILQRIEALAGKTAPERDKCQFCLGAKGGVPGNENRLNDVIACDYCTSLFLDARGKTAPEAGGQEGGAA
jgi:hypothetical protein